MGSFGCPNSPGATRAVSVCSPETLGAASSRSRQFDRSRDDEHLIPQHLGQLELCLVFPECLGEEAEKDVHGYFVNSCG